MPFVAPFKAKKAFAAPFKSNGVNSGESQSSDYAGKASKKKTGKFPQIPRTPASAAKISQSKLKFQASIVSQAVTTKRKTAFGSKLMKQAPLQFKSTPQSKPTSTKSFPGAPTKKQQESSTDPALSEPHSRSKVRNQLFKPLSNASKHRNAKSSESTEEGFRLGKWATAGKFEIHPVLKLLKEQQSEPRKPNVSQVLTSASADDENSHSEVDKHTVLRKIEYLVSITIERLKDKVIVVPHVQLKTKLNANTGRFENVAAKSTTENMHPTENNVADCDSDSVANGMPAMLNFVTEQKCSSKDLKMRYMFYHVLAKSYSLLIVDQKRTLRDIYYEDVEFYGSQGVVDSAVLKLTRILGVPRHALNIDASRKGLVAGKIRIVTPEGAVADGERDFQLIPTITHGTLVEAPEADFVLVVEKDAVFQQLMAENFFAQYPSAILITGKGYPDVASRRLVAVLYEKYRLPLFAITDGDPHGFEIYLTYKSGSQAMSNEAAALAAPAMKLLGVLPSEIKKFNSSENSLIEMTNHDKNKARALLAREDVQAIPRLVTELNLMLTSGKKAEIESLTSCTKDVQTFVGEYLPYKLRVGGWI